MAATLRIECRSSGSGARFTDGGRPGLRHLAIPRGGAADVAAMGAGNAILQQPSESTALELTLSGGIWLLSGRGQLALTGADMGWRLDGKPVERYQTIDVDGTHELRGGYTRSGCRAYLCIRGHWDLPVVLGSVEPGLPGTVVPQPGSPVEIVARGTATFRSKWRGGESFPKTVVVPVHPGPEWRTLAEGHRNFLLEWKFELHSASDRHGLRLHAPDFPAPEVGNMLSSAVLPGTVQWTPSGLILLGPDAQTVGGYPRVLHAPSLPDGLFQLLPGGEIRFEWIRAGL